MLNGSIMIRLKSGDAVRIRDRIKNHETQTEVIAVGAGVIVTCDLQRHFERFDADGWNGARTRQILGIVE